MKTNSAVEKDIIASSRRRGRGVRLRVVTLSMAGLLLLVSQVISDNAIANSRSIADCMRSAPYSAQEFLEKLLIVVDDQNPAALPKRFESTFGIKLRGAHTKDNWTFSLEAQCKWFTQVSIATHATTALFNGHNIPAFVSLDIGRIKSGLTPSLTFSVGDRCLTADLLETVLQTDDWKFIGRTRGLTVFAKLHASLNAVLWGADPARPCIQQLMFKFGDETN